MSDLLGQHGGDPAKAKFKILNALFPTRIAALFAPIDFCK